MKSISVVSLFLGILMAATVTAQDSIATRGSYYRVSMRFNNKHAKNKPMGCLVWITDSTLYYSKEKMPYSSFAFQDSSVEKFNYSEIKSVSLETGSPAATVLLPALTGFMAGAIIGFADGNDPPGFFSMTAGEKALLLGTAGFATGAVIGGIIAITKHHSFNIKGHPEKMQELVKFIRAREYPKTI